MANCETCDGTGKVMKEVPAAGVIGLVEVRCPDCNGTGNKK